MAALCLGLDPPADFGEFLATSPYTKERAERPGSAAEVSGQPRTRNLANTWCDAGPLSGYPCRVAAGVLAE